MNPISNTVPNPTPKPDREAASSNAADARQRGTGRESGFGTVLRELSGADKSPSSADNDAVTSEPDEAESDAAPASPPAAPASAAATMLANLLSIAGPPAHATANGAAQIQSQSVAAALVPEQGNLSTALLESVATPASGPPSGSAPARIASGSAEADAARTDVAQALSAAAAKIEVLGRTVHFKPVVPGPAQDAAPASPPEPAATEVGPANPRIVQSESPVLNAAAALKLPQPVRSEPDPRRGGATASDAEAEPEAGKPVAIAPAQGRAVAAVERALLASVGERAEDTASSAGSRDGTGTMAGLPAGSLPLIATAIKEELERATASQARSPADPAANGLPDGPLRTLRIQLRPEDLGTVTVEMRLSNGQLETHLRASQPETAALLHKDTALLTDLLSHSTYQAEVTVGQARPAEASAAPGGSPPQASPSFTDGGARPGNEGSRSRQGEQKQATNRREGERSDEAVRPRDSGVYL